jgi:hypothetical protein
MWSREEILATPTPVPAQSGIYGWYFRVLPSPEIAIARCVAAQDMRLLYVGIAPKATPATGKPSTQTLRSRVRYHFRGNAEGSTLRLTLGCLLADRLDIRLCRVGSGKRMTFTNPGEHVLSTWMAENAFVVWAPASEPWFWEEEALAQLDLPLNLSGNKHNAFHAPLSAIRAAAKADARKLPISN